MFLLIPILLALAPAPHAVSVGQWTLEQLVRFSDRVVVGRVERVVSVPCDRSAEAEAESEPPWERSWFWMCAEVSIAEVVVERTLLGPHAERVHYLAQPTWTCDTSKAVVGERVLLFLADRRWAADGGPRLEAALTELTGGAPVFVDAHSGHGRMPLRELNGREYADLDIDASVPPESLTTVPRPLSDRDDLRSAPLDELEAYVRRTGAHVLPRLMARRWSRYPDDPRGRIQAWVWADGVRFDSWTDDWKRGSAERDAHLLARAASLGAELARAGLSAAPYEDDAFSLGYLDARTSWRLVGPALDAELEWSGPARTLVLRARAQWNALMSPALRSLEAQR